MKPYIRALITDRPWLAEIYNAAARTAPQRAAEAVGGDWPTPGSQPIWERAREIFAGEDTSHIPPAHDIDRVVYGIHSGGAGYLCRVGHGHVCGGAEE